MLIYSFSLRSTWNVKCRSIRNTKLTTLCYVNKARVLLLFSWFNMLIKFCFKQSFSIASFVKGSQKRFWWLSHSVNLWTWYFLLSAQNVNKNLPRNVLHNKDCDPCISISTQLTQTIGNFTMKYCLQQNWNCFI